MADSTSPVNPISFVSNGSMSKLPSNTTTAFDINNPIPGAINTDPRLPGVTQLEAAGIQRRKAAQALENRLAQEKAKRDAALEDKYIRLGGDPIPRDTRAAQVLNALGINSPLMRALVASGQIHRQLK